MAVISLNGTKRERLGKGGARKSRAAGFIPGVVYGHGEDPIPIEIPTRDFLLAVRHHKGGNAIVNLALAGGEVTALIRDVQYDPLDHKILHLDFHHISLDEAVEVKVTIHLTGVPTGVKDGGGILEHIVREVEVRCLPTVIPAALDVDVAHLNVGDSVHVRDIKVENITILSDLDATIATVVPPTVIEEKAPEDVAVATEAAEPEVIAKGKKDEEAEGEGGAGEKKEKPEKKEKEKK
jgi:large subunit ribosomal protein L25